MNAVTLSMGVMGFMFGAAALSKVIRLEKEVRQLKNGKDNDNRSE